MCVCNRGEQDLEKWSRMWPFGEGHDNMISLVHKNMVISMGWGERVVWAEVWGGYCCHWCRREGYTIMLSPHLSY